MGFSTPQKSVNSQSPILKKRRDDFTSFWVLLNYTVSAEPHSLKIRYIRYAYCIFSFFSACAYSWDSIWKIVSLGCLLAPIDPQKSVNSHSPILKKRKCDFTEIWVSIQFLLCRNPPLQKFATFATLNLPIIDFALLVPTREIQNGKLFSLGCLLAPIDPQKSVKTQSPILKKRKCDFTSFWVSIQFLLCRNPIRYKIRYT